MNLNFFDWIRQGVRRSVLLGISDAAHQIGPEEDTEALNRQFLASLDEGRPLDGPKSGKGRSKRKTLGRSLSQIMDAEAQ